MTPQQPIYLGANTDKASRNALNDDFKLKKCYSKTLLCVEFFDRKEV